MFFIVGIPFDLFGRIGKNAKIEQRKAGITFGDMRPLFRRQFYLKSDILPHPSYSDVVDH